MVVAAGLARFTAESGAFSFSTVAESSLLGFVRFNASLLKP